MQNVITSALEPTRVSHRFRSTHECEFVLLQTRVPLKYIGIFQ